MLFNQFFLYDIPCGNFGTKPDILSSSCRFLLLGCLFCGTICLSVLRFVSEYIFLVEKLEIGPLELISVKFGALCIVVSSLASSCYFYTNIVTERNLYNEAFGCG